MVKCSEEKKKTAQENFIISLKLSGQHVKLLGQIKGTEIVLSEPVLKPKINVKVPNINVVIN